MLYVIQWLDNLQEKSFVCRPYVFEKVIVEGKTDKGEPVSFGIVGTCYSEFESGPNLWVLANIAAHFFGPGFYGLKSCEKKGYLYGYNAP